MDFNNKINRSSLHVEVTDRLREMIYEQSLPAGERIDELGLSARLGTSRTPLREALKVLAHEGLVKLVPGRGAFVTELSAEEIDALFPVLGMLQSRCAADAVRRQTPEDVAALDLYHQQIESAVSSGRTDDYHRAVDRFHERMQHMAANPWLTRAIIDLRRFLLLIRNRMPPAANRLRQSMAEFRTLMKAVHRADPEAAEQIVHLQAMAQQRAWRSLQQGPASPGPSSSAPQARPASSGLNQTGTAAQPSTTPAPDEAPATAAAPANQTASSGRLHQAAPRPEAASFNA